MTDNDLSKRVEFLERTLEKLLARSRDVAVATCDLAQCFKVSVCYEYAHDGRYWKLVDAVEKLKKLTMDAVPESNEKPS